MNQPDLGRTPMKTMIAAGIAALLAGAATAEPVTVTNVGYFLDTIGSNSIGIAGGGSAAGTPSTLFIANTAPGGGAGGTTASATYLSTGNPAGNPVLADSTGNLWARRALNPGSVELDALRVVFSNGPDTTEVITASLQGRTVMPLAIDFTLSGDPFAPLLSWTLPTGVDIDRVQMAFHNDDTNLEVGTRVTRSGSTTSLQLINPLPAGFNIVFDLRLVDLDDSIQPGQAWGTANVLSQSRTYISYSVPTQVVPEPGMLALLGAAGLMAGLARRRRPVAA